MRLSEGREEIYNLPDALLKIKDEEVKKKILIKIYENNNKKYLKQQEEYNKISKNSYTQYQLLFKKYGLDINSYTIDQNLDIVTVSDTLEKLSKIEFRLNQDEEQKFELNLEEMDLKELRYVLPSELQLSEGENVIEVTVYNSNGVSEETGIVRFVK